MAGELRPQCTGVSRSKLGGPTRVEIPALSVFSRSRGRFSSVIGFGVVVMVDFEVVDEGSTPAFHPFARRRGAVVQFDNVGTRVDALGDDRRRNLQVQLPGDAPPANLMGTPRGRARTRVSVVDELARRPLAVVRARRVKTRLRREVRPRPDRIRSRPPLRAREQWRREVDER